MTFPKKLTKAEALILFIRHRKFIRMIFIARQSLANERNQYRRAATTLESYGNPFDKNRIQKFCEMQDDCLRDIRSIEIQVNPIIEEFYSCLACLTTELSSAERASLIGATPKWLERKNPRWGELSLFGLLFNLSAESEKNTGAHANALYWFCGYMVTRNHDVASNLEMLEPDELYEPTTKRQHLSIVR